MKVDQKNSKIQSQRYFYMKKYKNKKNKNRKKKKMFSKETLDKVKLAKQFIENKYQSIITQEQKNQQNWKTILTHLGHNQGKDDLQLQRITQSIVDRQSINKRLQRQKDSLDNYKLYNVIGRGAFGEVRLARNILTSQVVAIKRLQKQYLLKKKQVYNAYLQRDFMIKNKSNFIVQMYSTFQDNDYLFIVMQYVQGGDLLHLLIQKDILSEQETRFYIAELILAIQEIHRMNYIHRDIKPDNILLDKNGHLKISDFGLSKYLDPCLFEEKDKENKDKDKDRKSTTTLLTKMEKLKKLSHIKNKEKMFSKVGTPDYISPEVLTDKVYTNAVDLWGVGVIMFECLFGYPPFTDEDSKQVCHKVANWVDYLQFPSDIQVSTSARMLMLGLMNHSNKRLTIPQIKQHPFFTNIKWQTLHKTKAPIIPEIKNEIDISNFDKFEITNPWTKIEKQLLQNFMRSQSKAYSEKNRKDQDHMDQETTDVFGQPDDQEEEDGHEDEEPTSLVGRNTVGPRFRFAGFDYRRIDSDPLERTAQDLVRKSYSHKPLKKILNSFTKVSNPKRLKTQQSSKPQKTNRISSLKSPKPKQKKAQKKRPSQFQLLKNSSTTGVLLSKQIREMRQTRQTRQVFRNMESNVSRVKNSNNISPSSKLHADSHDLVKQIYCSLGRKTKKVDDHARG